MNIAGILKQIWSIKWQALPLLACYVVYVWLAWGGIRLTGDDNDIRNAPAGRAARTGNHFYHK